MTDTTRQDAECLAARKVGPLTANEVRQMEGMAPLGQKRIALFEVKALADGDTNGEFEAVLSVPVVDRDGEVIDAKAFEPLPAEIPIHKFHDFSAPVATARPFYDGDILKAVGTFDPDIDSQSIRSKVGRSIRYMSVGFMAAKRATVDDVPHITKAELLEASFVSVPSNREAAILAVKGHTQSDPALVTALKALSDKIDLLLPKSPDTDPEKAAAEAGATKAPADAPADPPADVNVGMARLAALRAQAELLLLD